MATAVSAGGYFETDGLAYIVSLALKVHRLRAERCTEAHVRQHCSPVDVTALQPC